MSQTAAARSEELFREHQQRIYRRTDRMFAVLMTLQYFAGILAAWAISPRTWDGGDSAVHLHVWAAVILGAGILGVPILLAIIHPGRMVTRHIIAIGQMLDSALLIHLTGGRIETHFHVFGSLAFLGFYRDWRVLITASAVVGADHFLRGVYWPQSVYGVFSPSPFRWLEHTGWVVFSDIFITLACLQSVNEMREIAEHRALLEQTAQERAENITTLQEARAQLKEALEAKNSFLSVCGHELKTPLTSLSLQTQLVQRAILNGNMAFLTPERLRKLTEQTGSQVRRILRLVEDMVDHSRIQMGKLTISREDLELNGLVKEVIERCQSQADQVNCSIWFEENGAVRGRWDRFRIEQVVTNLITNAIKYGAGKPIEIWVWQDDRSAFVTVKDNGMGISPENFTKIFEQFERVSHHSHIAGLGLGLFISRGIVEQHGGKIHVESTLNMGSTFSVELPLDEAMQPLRRAEPARQAPADFQSS